MRKKLLDVGLGNFFFFLVGVCDTKSSGKQTNKKWDDIKLKTFWSVMEIIKKLKGNLQTGKKIVTNHILDELISKTYKECI